MQVSISSRWVCWARLHLCNALSQRHWEGGGQEVEEQEVRGGKVKWVSDRMGK